MATLLQPVAAAPHCNRQTLVAFCGSSLRRIVWTIATGVLIGLPWLHPSLSLLCIIGWAGLISSAANMRPHRAAISALVVGMIALGIAFHWAPVSIYTTSNLSHSGAWFVFLLLVAWESLAFVALAVAASLLARRGSRWLWMVVPVWVAVEYLHPQIFSWSLAHPYLAVIPLLQIAAWTGTAGISAVVMTLCVTLSRIQISGIRRCWMEIVPAIAVVFALYVWGVQQVEHWQHRQHIANQLRIAAVQVDPSNVGSVDQMRALSDSVDQPVDLYLWPESSLGNYDIALQDFHNEDRTVEMSEAPNPALDPYPNNAAQLLAGGKTYDDGGRDRGPYRNTAFLIGADKTIQGRYVKRTLMPIGEYVPGETMFPILRDWAAVESVMLPGTSDEPLQLAGGQQMGVLVCYEDMIAGNAAATTRHGAEFLVTLINGSGFTDPDALRQHLWLAQLRSVENRRTVVRCAATGVSCVIEPTGRIADKLPIGQSAVLTASIPLTSELSFYTRYGDWFSQLATILVATMIVCLKFNLTARTYDGHPCPSKPNRVAILGARADGFPARPL